MGSSHNLKICSGMPLEALYFSVQLLQNCYNCLYGNLTSERFNCQPPRARGLRHLRMLRARCALGPAASFLRPHPTTGRARAPHLAPF